MFRMAVGHSDDIDVERALDAVLHECDVGLHGATPKGGLLLASWDSDQRALVDRIRGRYPGIELAGATSAGEMSSVLGFAEDSVALALFASDAIDFTVGMGRDLATDPGQACRRAVEEARAKSRLTPSLCIAMPTIGPVDASFVLDALRRRARARRPDPGRRRRSKGSVRQPGERRRREPSGRRGRGHR